MTNGSAVLRADAARDARLAWTIGGGLLIAYAVLPLLFRGVPFAALSYVVDSLWALSLLLFAFGIRGSGSVVARRGGGVGALIVAAVTPLFVLLAVHLAATKVAPGVGLAVNPPGAVSPEPIDPAADSAWAISSMVGQAGSILLFVAPLVAAFMIGRAGALPRRARWVPLIAVACGPTVALFAQLIVVAQPGRSLDGIIWVLEAGSMLTTTGYLLLGILATVWASRASAPLGESLPAADDPGRAEG